jgi:hypothetical protein
VGTLDAIFLALNYSVVPAWLLLALAPRWKWTDRIVHSGAYPFAIAIAYGIILFGDQPGPQGAHFFTLEGVERIFTSRQTIIACWAHYLAFDLFVGSWEVRDAQRLGIRHLFVVPALFLTLMFGPLGLALWLAIRFAMRRAITLREAG